MIIFFTVCLLKALNSISLAVAHSLLCSFAQFCKPHILCYIAHKTGGEDVNKISNVSSFLLAKFGHLEKQCPQPLNVYHQSSTCLILELGLHFKLFDFVEFLRLFFSPLARKIIFEKIQLNQKV